MIWETTDLRLSMTNYLISESLCRKTQGIFEYNNTIKSRSF